MDYREEVEETADPNRAVGPSVPPEPSTSGQPSILRPDVVPRGDVGSSFDALAKGFPDVIQKAKGFYAKHPTLVKAVGTVFVAAIARRLFRGRPGLF